MTINRLTVSAIVLTHNSEGTISKCLSSVERQSICSEIIVVDNGSSDRTLEIIRPNHPNVRIIETGANRGYALGNNLGIRESGADLFVVLNPDTELLDGAIANLVEPLTREGNLFTTPLILLPDKNTVNVCGLYCTPTGMSFPRGLGYAPEELKELPPANGLSGCCFAGRRDVFLEIGGFDESFFMYNEDSDLSWRAHLKGIRITTVPTSVAIHHYNSEIDLFKLFHLERNRYFLLRKHMPLRWVVLYLPSLISIELLSMLTHCRFGVAGIRKKKDAWIDALNRRDELSDGDRARLRNALMPVFPKEPTVTGIHSEDILRSMLSGLLRANWWLVK